jgi:hypothetical protein
MILSIPTKYINNEKNKIADRRTGPHVWLTDSWFDRLWFDHQPWILDGFW